MFSLMLHVFHSQGKLGACDFTFPSRHWVGALRDGDRTFAVAVWCSACPKFRYGQVWSPPTLLRSTPWHSVLFVDCDCCSMQYGLIYHSSKSSDRYPVYHSSVWWWNIRIWTALYLKVLRAPLWLKTNKKSPGLWNVEMVVVQIMGIYIWSHGQAALYHHHGTILSFNFAAALHT